jgi:CRP/FNR family cyclic AMP-dependent transcriptional regulator
MRSAFERGLLGVDGRLRFNGVMSPQLPITLDKRFSNEHVRAYSDGDVVFQEGDEGRELYVIQSGAVVIKKQTDVGELSLARFEKGDFFGDMALLQGIPRFASAHAVGPTKLLVLQPGGFLLKIRRDPTFAFEMLQQLSLRVKVSNERLIQAVKSGGMGHDAVQEILNAVEGSESR